MLFTRIRIGVCTGLAALLLQSGAPAYGGEPTNQFVSDAYLVRSLLARGHPEAVAYSDAKYGKLIHDVLDPKRTKKVCEDYIRIPKTEDAPDFFRILSPILIAYSEAFTRSPEKYEGAYLDGIESMVHLGGAEAMRRQGDTHCKTDALHKTAYSGILADDIKKKRFSAKGEERARKLITEWAQ